MNLQWSAAPGCKRFFVLAAHALNVLNSRSDAMARRLRERWATGRPDCPSVRVRTSSGYLLSDLRGAASIPLLRKQVRNSR